MVCRRRPCQRGGFPETRQLPTRRYNGFVGSTRAARTRGFLKVGWIREGSAIGWKFAGKRVRTRYFARFEPSYSSAMARFTKIGLFALLFVTHVSKLKITVGYF